MQRNLYVVFILLLGLSLASCGTKKGATVSDVLPEAIYEAFGNEPYWNVRVTEESIFVTMMNDEPMQFNKPEAQQRGAYTVYETSRKKKGTTNTIRVAFANQACNDSMSGNRYSYKVRFTIDGEDYEGCGNGPGM